MSEDIESLKAENQRLLNRIKMLEAPFDLENASIISINIEDSTEDIYSVRVARINDCEFINGGMYMSLISKHFNEVQEGIVLRMVGNRMASSIDEASRQGVASKNMIDSLNEWNNMIGINNQEIEQQKN
jgi:hypothetical protein